MFLRYLYFFFAIYVLSANEQEDACVSFDCSVVITCPKEDVEKYWFDFVQCCDWTDIPPTVQAALFVMGYNEEDYSTFVPITTTMCYAQLSQQAKSVATTILCWTPETWDHYTHCDENCIDRDDLVSLFSAGMDIPFVNCADVLKSDQAEQFCNLPINTALIALGAKPEELHTMWDLTGLFVKDFCRVTCNECTQGCSHPDCDILLYPDMIKSFWDTHYDSCTWDSLDDNMQKDLQILGFTTDTWNLNDTQTDMLNNPEVVGQAALELSLCWNQLTVDGRAAASRMCFDQESWDVEVRCACVDRDDYLDYITDGKLTDCAYGLGTSIGDQDQKDELCGGFLKDILQSSDEGVDVNSISRDISELYVYDICRATCGDCGISCERPICDSMKEDVVKSFWETYQEHCVWSSIPIDLQTVFLALGWEDDTWDQSYRPWQATLCWDQLSSQMQNVAQTLCYTRDSWDDEVHCEESVCVDRDEILQVFTKGTEVEITNCKWDIFDAHKKLYASRQEICGNSMLEVLMELGSTPKISFDLEHKIVAEFCPASCNVCESEFYCKRPKCGTMATPVVASFWRTFFQSCEWGEISGELLLDLQDLGWNEEIWENHSAPIAATLCWTQLSPKIKKITESLCFAYTSWNLLADCHAESCVDRDDLLNILVNGTPINDDEPLLEASAADCANSGIAESDCDSEIFEALDNQYGIEKESFEYSYEKRQSIAIFEGVKVKNLCRISCGVCNSSCKRPVCKNFNGATLVESYWETFHESCVWEQVPVELQAEFMVLGYNEDTWEGTPPLKVHLCWEQQDDETIEVLKNLCFNAISWNKWVHCPCWDLTDSCLQIDTSDDFRDESCEKSVQEIELEVPFRYSEDLGINEEAFIWELCEKTCQQCELPPIPTVNNTNLWSNIEYVEGPTKVVFHTVRSVEKQVDIHVVIFAAIGGILLVAIIGLICHQYGNYEVKKKFHPDNEPEGIQDLSMVGRSSFGGKAGFSQLGNGEIEFGTLPDP